MLPRWIKPVGEGAKRVRTVMGPFYGRGRGALPGPLQYQHKTHAARLVARLNRTAHLAHVGARDEQALAALAGCGARVGRNAVFENALQQGWLDRLALVVDGQSHDRFGGLQRDCDRRSREAMAL